MKFLIDENVLYANKLFQCFGEVKSLPGREIFAPIPKQVSALIVRSVTKVNKALLDGSQVKFVGSATSGTDHVDKEWLQQAGISFSAALGCNAIAVVEYVLSALLYLSQRDGFSLHDKVVGIIGVGHIGRELQKRLNIFGIRTLLCDPPLAEAGIYDENWQSLETLVNNADILTFHTPLTYTGRHSTWHLVDDSVLAALPDGRIIINTCRGAVIDNVALLQALKSGKNLNVVLDVWELEPCISLDLLSHIDIGTPHIAGYSLEGKARGTAQVFNSYSAHVGSEIRTNLQDLLPPPTIRYIHLSNGVDEEILRLLANLIYDIRKDDMHLRRSMTIPDVFDRLRKNYHPRREWSSIVVEIEDYVGCSILQNIGFRANYRTCN
ncbi:4-phosphoerythronate dehydrogenase [Sodalis sp. CWE]|uniref:4-phosphoerythronate dehydrogenase n=1 Tax=Sodalis sp. CWE TaxID=2803816 RepID=UPI001C7DFADC|nr:4-phosphoerythronate dehydrogenase [Sodalis sp. CWE]MBX4181087.1 4-phosphoerythronate dehydrogenase [Sodalis sp. CWE]